MQDRSPDESNCPLRDAPRNATGISRKKHKSPGAGGVLPGWLITFSTFSILSPTPATYRDSEKMTKLVMTWLYPGAPYASDISKCKSGKFRGLGRVQNPLPW